MPRRAKDDPDRKRPAPSLRTLVRWAVKCQDAEELGRKIRQRYDSGRQPSGRERAEEESMIAKLLDKR
jgi:hypothetical protein